jgi:hypothetical protein
LLRSPSHGGDAGDSVKKPLDPSGGQTQEDVMKSRLLLLTGIVALAFGGPISASAATIDILDNSGDQNDPTVTVSNDFIGTPSMQRTPEVDPASGRLQDALFRLSGAHNAANPLAANIQL